MCFWEPICRDLFYSRPCSLLPLCPPLPSPRRTSRQRTTVATGKHALFSWLCSLSLRIPSRDPVDNRRGELARLLAALLITVGSLRAATWWIAEEQQHATFRYTYTHTHTHVQDKSHAEVDSSVLFLSQRTLHLRCGCLTRASLAKSMSILASEGMH